MRDQRYVASHRGGPLSLERHRQLALWAADCAEHVLDIFSARCPEDARPRQAIEMARAWARGEVPVGAAQKASLAAHAAARAAEEGAARFAARAAGQAVASAHMADHAPGAAFYAIRALKAAAPQEQAEVLVAQEHRWQKLQLPAEIRELVLSTFDQKFASFGLSGVDPRAEPKGSEAP